MVVFCIVLYCFLPKVIIQSKKVISYVKGTAVLLICLCTIISKNLIVCVIYLYLYQVIKPILGSTPACHIARGEFESMTTHRQTTGRHDNSPTACFTDNQLADTTTGRQDKSQIFFLKTRRQSPTLTDRTFPRKGMKVKCFQGQYCFMFRNEHE